MSPTIHPAQVDTADLLEFLLNTTRLGTATFLLAIFFYLQVVAEGRGETGSDPISWQFRILPAVLAFFLLHQSGRIALFPFSTTVTAIVLYTSFILMLSAGFRIVLRYYGLQRPRDRIPEFVRETIPGLRPKE
jgi:hypothetical protein